MKIERRLIWLAAFSLWINWTASSFAESSDPSYLIVQKGMTLSQIAETYLKSFRRVKELAELNRIANADQIYEGQKIRLLPQLETSSSVETKKQAIAVANADTPRTTDLKKAAEVLAREKAMNPSDPGPFISELRAALSLKDFKKARKLVEEFESRFPELAELPYLKVAKEQIASAN